MNQDRAVKGSIIAVFFVVLASLGPAPTVFADIVEVDGNIKNGTILSQDEKEVRFRDPSGVEHVYPKAKVGYLHIETTKPAGEEASRVVREKTSGVMKAVKNAVEGTKKASKRVSSKTLGVISKPLDRSAADKKGKDMGDAMAQYAEESKKLAATQKKMVSEQKKNELFVKRMKMGLTATEKDISGHGKKKKSSFSSLD